MGHFITNFLRIENENDYDDGDVDDNAVFNVNRNNGRRND